MAERWEYGITEDEEGINFANTTAIVDTEKREIRLPKVMPNMVDFLGDGFEYIVLTPEGVKKVNTDGSMTLVAEKGDPNNPISAIAGSSHPDFIVARETTVTHYSFTGNEDAINGGYVPNPIFATGGYTNILSVGTKELDHAILNSDGNVTYQAFTGDAMVPANALSPKGFSNPIAMTVFKDHYGIAVVDGDEIKYFKEGSSVTSTISGLTNILSISAADGGNIAVVANNQVKHYNLLEGNAFAYNSHLSTIAGLTSPTCVALRPGSYDRIIVDGNNVNYYMWTGSEFVKNGTMSKTIEGLQDIGKYLPKAVAESIIYSLTGDKMATHIKLWIDTEEEPMDLPEGTKIKWFISASEDDDSWIETELGKWITLPEPGKDFRWKAELSTTNRNNTPKIFPVIVLQTNSRPDPPEVYEPTGCYLNSSPVIHWKYNDPDGDPQNDFQIVVTKRTGEIILDQTVKSGEHKYIIDKEATGFLWDTGTSEFSVKVKVWDTLTDSEGNDVEGVESEWSETINFCVIAYDRPVISKIVTPHSSDIAISKGMSVEDIPETKAGGLVTLEVDSIGVDSAKFEFPYLTKFATIAETKIMEGYEDKTNKKWQVSFYTSADPDVCPTGTIIYGLFEGNGIPELLRLNAERPDYNNEPGPETPNWWQWPGYRWWAEGVVKINDTAFKNWSVILQGRNKN